MKSTVKYSVCLFKKTTLNQTTLKDFTWVSEDTETGKGEMKTFCSDTDVDFHKSLVAD